MLDLQALYKNPSDYDYKRVDNLKDGKGTCEIYSKKEPSAPYYEEGVIVMMEVGGIYPSIGIHTHAEDEETYTVIHGIFEINGTIFGPDESATCKRGDSHNAQLISQYGALKFQKVKTSAA